jgi:hypothetical protein
MYPLTERKLIQQIVSVNKTKTELMRITLSLLYRLTINFTRHKIQLFVPN